MLPTVLCLVQYPSENAYQEFLSEHGGASNAFTAADRACYFFDVSHQYLRGALDRCVYSHGAKVHLWNFSVLRGVSFITWACKTSIN